MADVETKEAYHVEVGKPACEHCGEGETWVIVDLDGVAGGTNYDNESDAEEEATSLNKAFEAGIAYQRHEDKGVAK